MRHGNVLSHVTIATDPVYLTEPYIRSQEFVLMDRNNTNWLYNCEYVNEVPRPRHQVPMFLPGKNPWLGEVGAKYGMPQEAVRGGAATTRPEYAETIRSGKAARAEGAGGAGGADAGGADGREPPWDGARRRGAYHARPGQRAHDRRRRRQRGRAGRARRRRGRGHGRRRHGREGARRRAAAVGQADPLDRQHDVPPAITSAATSRWRSPAAP